MGCNRCYSRSQPLNATPFSNSSSFSSCKLAEAEIISLSQRKRIEELEFQLHDAEDAVRDLRAELKRVQDEMEDVQNNTVQALDEQTVKEIAVSPVDTSEENKLNTSDSILLPLSDSGAGPMSTCDMKNAPLSERNNDDECCFVLENETTQAEPSSDSRAESYYAVNPDLASIIMRSKEPEPYKNGCTQRIRAFERNLLIGKLPPSGHTDDQYSHIKNESIIREGEKDERYCTVSSATDDDKVIMGKNPTDLKEVMQHDSSCDKDQTVIQRFSSRRRSTRYRNTKTTSCSSVPDQVMKACEQSVLSFSGTLQHHVNRNVDSCESPSKIIQDETQKVSESHLSLIAPITTKVDPQLACTVGTRSNAGVNKACSAQNATNEDVVLIDESVLTRQEGEAVDSSGVSEFNIKMETMNVPLVNSNAIDEITCGATTGAPTQAATDGLLKYTFQRKRKKGSLSCPDKNASFDKNTLKKKIGDKQRGAPEPQKPSLIIESSRDSRRLAQVARQLISLSEKRW